MYADGTSKISTSISVKIADFDGWYGGHDMRRSSLEAAVVHATVMTLVVSAMVVPPTVSAAAPAPPQRTTATATPGAGPVSRPLPASATPNHGYPKGQRPPVVPPGIPAAGPQRILSKQEWERTTTRSAGITQAEGAINLILRPGFDFTGTSLVLYFDAAEPGISGWQSWFATVFDPVSGAAQQSRVMQPSEAKPCQVPAQYCRSFGSEQGWTLVGGQQYFATITVTFNDGSQVISAASGNASARTTADPPVVPQAQLSGCACLNALFLTTSGQAVRGSGVSTGTGTFSTTWPDLALAGFGITFNATRFYSSGNTTAGTMGIGWSWSYDIRVIPPAPGGSAVTVRAEDGARAVYTAGANGSYNRPPGVSSNLVAVTGGGWKLVTPLQDVYTFDAGGRLLSKKDPRGNGVTLSYSSGSVTITDAAGRVVTGTLNASGLLTKLALPDRRSVIYKYTNGMLTSAQDAASNTWTFGYTGGLLTTVVDPQGRSQLTNTYANGRVTRQVDASGAPTTFVWNPTNQEAITTDADGVATFDGYRSNVLVYSQNDNGDATNQRFDSQVDTNLIVDPHGNQTAMLYDTASNMLSVTAPDPFSFQTTNTFDGSNNLTTHTDALGHAMRYGYTAASEVQSIINASGEENKLTYDNRGLITAITDPRGKVTTLAYDSAGNLTSQTSPMNEVTTYTYDESGRLITKVEPRGNLPGARPLDFTTTYTYDKLDRVTGVLAPRKAHASSVTFDSVGQVTATADPLNHQTTYTYNTVIGRTATVTDPNGGITRYTYTAAGREASITDQMGNKTTITYDNRGNVSTVTSPRGNVAGANPADFTTTYIFDSNGNRVQVRHPYPGGGTLVTDTTFDQLGRPTSQTDPLGNTTRTVYDNNSSVTSTADALGATTTYSYDADGRPTAAVPPSGPGTSVERDTGGNVVKSTSAIGGVTRYTYDDDDRLISVVEPRGSVPGANPADFTIRYGYDVAGNITSVTDQIGGRTTFTYDANNRVTGVTDSNGHTMSYNFLDSDALQSVVGPDGNTQLATTYSYDNVGNVISRTDGRGNTRFTYDKLGRVTLIKDPLNRDSLFTYDAEGNLSTSVAPGDTDPAIRTIAYTYDILNRLTKQDHANGSLVYNRGYDADNRLTSLVDPAGERRLGYDAAGRLTSVSRGTATFTYGYDTNDNITSRTWPDGTNVGTTFNADNTPATVTVQGGQAGPTQAQYTLGYDAAGRLTRTTSPTANHLVTDRRFDRAGRLSDLDSHNDVGTVLRYQMTRDPVGNPTGITTTRGTASQHVAYTYDLFDRLTAACIGADCASATGKVAYTYDQVGNRLSQTLSGSAGNSQTTYAYDSASQLNQATITDASGTRSTAYTYDRSGNLVQAGGNTFTFNLDHSLASATIGGSTTSYAYDALGIQISATTNAGGGTQTRTWQTDLNNRMPQLVAQTTTTGAGSTSQGFLNNPGDGTPLGLLAGGQALSYAKDPFQGVGNVVNASGNTVAAYDYDPFGMPRTDGTAAGVPNSVANPIQFAGAYQDTTLGGQYSMLARAYDPATGRFNGYDPVASPISQPSVSPYAYVADRPTFLRDPSGAAPCSANDEHDKAQLYALERFRAQYGRDNVYGDCPRWQSFHGRPGQIKLYNTEPASQPDILVGNQAITWLYEIKPAANQIGEMIPGVSGIRGDNNAAQVARYLWALSEYPALYPNPRPGPNIVPGTKVHPDGSTTTIFSGVDWNKFANPSANPDIRNAGIIYYIFTKKPKVRTRPRPERVPQEEPRTVPAQQPREIPTIGHVESTPNWVPVVVVGACILGGLIIVGTLVEDFFTAGIGIADDAPSFAAAGALFAFAGSF